MSRLADRVVPARLGQSFRWLLASSWVTNLGDGITLAAGPLLVAAQTHNPLAVAMATFLQRLPWLMFGLYAGVVADRGNRRVIVITTGLVRVAILLLLTASILTHRVDTAVVLAVLFGFGVNEAFGETTTTTLLPTLVEQRDLGLANARTLTGTLVWGQMAGPPVGAALFALGMALPFVSEAGCVLAGVLLIARVRLPAHVERERTSRVRDDIREGWRWLWAHPAVRTLAIAIFTFNVTFGAAWSVLVLYAQQRLGTSALGFGLITTAIAVGGLLGGLRRARVHLGHHIDQRAAAGGAGRVSGPRRQRLPHRCGWRHRDWLRARRTGRIGVGRHRTLLVRLRRLGHHSRAHLALATADSARR